MPTLDKALRREKKWRKRRYGIQRSGDSVKLIQKILDKKAARIRKKRRKQKEASYYVS